MDCKSLEKRIMKDKDIEGHMDQPRRGHSLGQAEWE